MYIPATRLGAVSSHGSLCDVGPITVLPGKLLRGNALDGYFPWYDAAIFCQAKKWF